MLREIIVALKKIRTEKKVTHEELSRRAGISQKHISSIENYKTKPSLETLEKLAKGLGTKLNFEITAKASGE